MFILSSYKKIFIASLIGFSQLASQYFFLVITKPNKFPPAIKVGDRTTLWSYAVIENWVAQQQKTQDFIDNQDLDL